VTQGGKLILVAQKQGRNFQYNWLIACILLVMSSFQAESTASTKNTFTPLLNTAEEESTMAKR
jgi:hypothetical protein